MPTLYTVIRRPLITEKGLGVKETEKTLVFDVAPGASKTEVKHAAAASSRASSRTGRRLTCG
jgi:large subunit ribosomal protein L23